MYSWLRNYLVINLILMNKSLWPFVSIEGKRESEEGGRGRPLHRKYGLRGLFFTTVVRLESEEDHLGQRSVTGDQVFGSEQNSRFKSHNSRMRRAEISKRQ